MAQPLDEILRDLDISEALVNVGSLTNQQLLQTLTGAQDYIRQADPANSDAEALKSIIVAELAGEISKVKALDGTAPADASQWPRQRAAIERAYYFDASNTGALEEAAAQAQARADALNGVLNKAADVGKGIGTGLEEILSLVVVLVVVLVVLNLVGRKA